MPESSYTVLVVEEAPLLRRIAGRTLSAAGYRILEAAHADEALGLLSMPPDGRIDLVLLDALLPEKHGVMLYSDIRIWWPKIPVLFMSAYPIEVVARHGHCPSNLRCLGEPFTPEDLLAKVGATIERRRAPRQYVDFSPLGASGVLG